MVEDYLLWSLLLTHRSSAHAQQMFCVHSDRSVFDEDLITCCLLCFPSNPITWRSTKFWYKQHIVELHHSSFSVAVCQFVCRCDGKRFLLCQFSHSGAEYRDQFVKSKFLLKWTLKVECQVPCTGQSWEDESALWNESAPPTSSLSPSLPHPVCYSPSFLLCLYLLFQTTNCTFYVEFPYSNAFCCGEADLSEVVKCLRLCSDSPCPGINTCQATFCCWKVPIAG